MKKPQEPEPQVNIMRYPCLMEDEGRHFFISGPMPRAEAEAWIANQKGEYFGPGSYYLTGPDKKPL
jgi:hypothetical protein